MAIREYDEKRIENINAYVNSESLPDEYMLLSLLYFTMSTMILTAILGGFIAYSVSTLLPITTIYTIWSSKLLKTRNPTDNIFRLYIGLSSLLNFLTIVIIIMKYSYFKNIYSGSYIIFLVLSCLCIIMLFYFRNRQRIMDGYYKTNRKHTLSFGYVILIISMVIIRRFLRENINELSQELFARIIVYSLSFLAFIFLMGTHNFQKYYYAKKYNIGVNIKSK